MAITTTNARVQAGLAYVNKASSTYLALGRTTAWTDEGNPPTEDPNTNILQEVIGYKKASTVSLCKLLAKGETTSYKTVTYGGNTYALVTADKAYQEKATLVYFEAIVEGTELPTGTYRQVGIHTGLSPKSGVTKSVLLPTEVQSTGTLEFFANKQFQNRTIEVKVTERFILSISDTKEII